MNNLENPELALEENNNLDISEENLKKLGEQIDLLDKRRIDLEEKYKNPILSEKEKIEIDQKIEKARKVLRFLLNKEETIKVALRKNQTQTNSPWNDINAGGHVRE